jgi:hypothetical protein
MRRGRSGNGLQRRAARGDHYYNWERFSTGFVTSAVSRIVDKRSDKCWKPQGVHLLLGTRRHTLDSDLDRLIRCRCCAFKRSAANDAAPLCNVLAMTNQGVHLACQATFAAGDGVAGYELRTEQLGQCPNLGCPPHAFHFRIGPDTNLERRK